MILSIAILIIIVLAWFYYTKFYLIEKKANIKNGLSLLRCTLTLRLGKFDNIVEYITKNNVFQDFIYLWFGPQMMIFAVDPESAKFVLKSPQFRKIGIIKLSDYSDQFFEEHILAKDGEDYRRHRTIVSPGFNCDALTSYYPLFIELTEKAIKTLPDNGEVELSDFFSRFTLDILGKAIFNHDFGRIDGKNDKHYDACRHIMGGISTTKGFAIAAFPLVEKLPLSFVKEHKENVDILVKFFSEMIDQHKDKNDNSILAKLIHHADPDSADVTLSKKELIANIFLFFIAGHDTTSNAMAWAGNCLRNYPDIQEKVFQEINSIIGVDKIPTEEDLQKLVYLDFY